MLRPPPLYRSGSYTHASVQNAAGQTREEPAKLPDGSLSLEGCTTRPLPGEESYRFPRTASLFNDSKTAFQCLRVGQPACNLILTVDKAAFIPKLTDPTIVHNSSANSLVEVHTRRGRCRAPPLAVPSERDYRTRFLTCQFRSDGRCVGTPDPGRRQGEPPKEYVHPVPVDVALAAATAERPSPAMGHQGTEP